MAEIKCEIDDSYVGNDINFSTTEKDMLGELSDLVQEKMEEITSQNIKSDFIDTGENGQTAADVDNAFRKVKLKQTTKKGTSNKSSSTKHNKNANVNVGKSAITHTKHGIILKRPTSITNKLIKKAVKKVRGDKKERKAPSFTCNLCLKKFSLNGLKEHLKEHCIINGDELQCKTCSKILMSGKKIMNFNLHLRYIYTSIHVHQGVNI